MGVRGDVFALFLYSWADSYLFFTQPIIVSSHYLNILRRQNLEPLRISRVSSFLQMLDLQKCALTVTFYIDDLCI